MVRSSILCKSSHNVDGIAVVDDGRFIAERTTGRPAASPVRIHHATSRSASKPCSRVTRAETLIWLVVIAWMLIFASARDRNMRSATPVWVAMPRPTIDTLETFAS